MCRGACKESVSSTSNPPPCLDSPISKWHDGQRRINEVGRCIRYDRDVLGMTSLLPSRYSRAFWILIRTYFPSSRSTRPKSHSLKVLQGASHRRRRGSAFSVRFVKYWNKASVFRCYGSFCQYFQETVGGSLDRSLSPSLPLTEHSPPPHPGFSLPPPPSHLHITH